MDQVNAIGIILFIIFCFCRPLNCDDHVIKPQDFINGHFIFLPSLPTSIPLFFHPMLNLTKQSVKRSLLRQAAVVTPPPQPRQLQKFAHDVPQDETAANDFILSILHASPSARDSKLYLKSFGPQPKRSPKSSDSLETSSTIPPPQEHSSETPSQQENGVLPDSRMNVSADASATTATTRTVTTAFKQEVVSQILDPTTRHTGLIKIQGPFNDIQLESICRGMVYLEKLGLVSVIVIENDEWTRGMDGERRNAIEEVRRVVRMLEMQGARARPIVQPVARLGPRPGDEVEGVDLPEAHALPETWVGSEDPED
ncbi:uncharacterized protein EI90DRAFT_3166443 [Cantharellus anzutake]|uniref:uncharacterized protein n=1 Tax=Cantharellus anzutake TaxID=1750568 RepID=UPI0019070540|nr:uncharacterized protein EI90DRAFT_3166443 [Cantharellus anzutake]KAF8336956.1 hypothetical protein EI90DRAFT_3166443 [Cantharellus anzutake]